MAGEIFFLAKISEKSTRNGGQSTRFVGDNYSGKYYRQEMQATISVGFFAINQHILLYDNVYDDHEGIDNAASCNAKICVFLGYKSTYLVV